MLPTYNSLRERVRFLKVLVYWIHDIYPTITTDMKRMYSVPNARNERGIQNSNVLIYQLVEMSYEVIYHCRWFNIIYIMCTLIWWALTGSSCVFYVCYGFSGSQPVLHLTAFVWWRSSLMPSSGHHQKTCAAMLHFYLIRQPNLNDDQRPHILCCDLCSSPETRINFVFRKRLHRELTVLSIKTVIHVSLRFSKTSHGRTHAQFRHAASWCVVRLSCKLTPVKNWRCYVKVSVLRCRIPHRIHPNRSRNFGCLVQIIFRKKSARL